MFRRFNGGAGGPVIAGPYGAPGASGAGGVVRVDIMNRNAPPDTTMMVTATGPVRATGKVETAMGGGGGAP